MANSPTNTLQFTPPSVDNLINNLPEILKSSRQFLPWNVEKGEKKVPLGADGRSWGNFRDPLCWRTFSDVIELLYRGNAFGIGLVLPSQEDADMHPDFDLVTGLVAIDGDAKRSPAATPYHVPENITGYVNLMQTYSEFSTSSKGLRSLAFGEIPTQQQKLTKSFGDGTELSLYRRGWVTLSGLVYGGSHPTIEHRQGELDRILAEQWPGLKTGPVPVKAKADVCSGHFGEQFVLDWSRTASEDCIRQFIQGFNRNPKQAENIQSTWELNRGWNHGSSPDASLYSKRIVEEALWLQRPFHWTLQDVVDLVVTFCKKNGLRWSFGRAKKQIADAQHYVLNKRDCLKLYSPPAPPTTLTGKRARTNGQENREASPTLTSNLANQLRAVAEHNLADTLTDCIGAETKLKLSGNFKHKSAVRDAILNAISRHPGWVKARTIAAETGKSQEAVRKQLQRLNEAGLVDRDRKGRYRKHHERRHRGLKPCTSKPFPKCRGTDQERKMLSRSALRKRGWPLALIDGMFPTAGADYNEREIDLTDQIGRIVKARFYWVSRIRAMESQAWFEIERAKANFPTS